MLGGLLGPLDAGAKVTQVKLAEAQMEFIVLPRKAQMWSSGMAGSRSSKPAPSLGSAFCASAPPPGGAFVGWQRALGSTRLPFSLFSHLRGGRALNSSVLKCKSQVGSDWPSLSHMLIADYYGQGGGMF